MAKQDTGIRKIPFENVLPCIQDCITYPTISGQEGKLVEHLIDGRGGNSTVPKRVELT